MSVSSSGTELISGRGVEELGTVPALSANGRFVAFSSRGKNLVEGDRNNTDDIFVLLPIPAAAGVPGDGGGGY